MKGEPARTKKEGVGGEDGEGGDDNDGEEC